MHECKMPSGAAGATMPRGQGKHLQEELWKPPEGTLASATQ